MRLSDNVKGTLTRALLAPAVVAAIAGGAVLAFPQGEATATAPDPTTAAIVQVAEQETDLTAGRTCYDDPTGHAPTTAVVKDDGGTTAYRITAQDAWDAAHRGDVWILSWCD